jgi:voltage-gated potassium channel Kch
MTAVALLVVLGSAVLMDLGGLSMAMGAFLAGVMLSESSFRHQLEADIEPFRGLLLGLFFLAVGMTLDLQAVADSWLLIGAAVVALMLMKALAIYLVARLMRTPHSDALDRALLMAQGGEFAFVLFAAAHEAGAIDARVNANMTAIVILSMVLTPIVVLVYRRLKTAEAVSMQGVEEAHDARASVLIIGFGRFAHIASQAVLARGASLTIIDTDPEVARIAADFGFKVYFGDGARPDVLHAAGAGSAQIIMVCIDDKVAATRIAEIARHEYPQAAVMMRVHDREHLIEVLRVAPAFQIRETFESALVMGEAAAQALGATNLEAQAITEEVRRRDQERLDKQIADGIYAGRDLLRGNAPLPAQLRPQR